jgi:acetyl-CoA hydrolase
LPKNLLPLQSGIGNIANAVIGGLAESKFEHLKVWTEVLLVLGVQTPGVFTKSL